MIHNLLKNEALYARRVKEKYKPVFNTKQEYFDCINKIQSKKELVNYIGKHEAVISY